MQRIQPEARPGGGGVGPDSSALAIIDLIALFRGRFLKISAFRFRRGLPKNSVGLEKSWRRLFQKQAFLLGKCGALLAVGNSAMLSAAKRRQSHVE